MKAVFRFFLMSIATVAFGPISQLNGQIPQVGELRIALVRVEPQAAKPLFRVELQNAGDHALTLNLGMMLANGKMQYPMAIKLSLTDSSGRSFPLELIGPGIIAGRVDPLVVPLPPGATYSVPVDLAEYCSPKANLWKPAQEPARYKLRAIYTGVGVSQQEANLDLKGISLMNYWTGTIGSEVISFRVLKPHP